MAHEWGGWLHNCYLRSGPLGFRARGKIRGGTQVDWVATLVAEIKPNIFNILAKNQHVNLKFQFFKGG